VACLQKVIRFRDWSVRQKLVALLVAASLVPLGVSAVLDLRAARTRLRANAADLLAAHADQLRSQLDTFHATYLLTATKLARLPALAAFDHAAGAELASAVASVRAIFVVYVTTDPDVKAIGFVDRTGTVIAATEPRMEGTVIADRGYVRQALRGAPIISEVYVAEPALDATATVAYATAVDGSTGPAGIVVLWVRARALWELTRSANELAGPGSFAVVFDPQGILIAHTASAASVFHPSGALAPEVVEPLVAERRFGAGTRRLLEDVLAFPEAFARARAAAPDPGLFRAPAPVNQQWNYGVARRLATVPWTLLYMLPERVLDEQSAALARDKLILAGLIMLFAFALGLALAVVILRPVVSLSAATQLIASGDLSARVPPGGDLGDDEVGRLCASFNAMAERIERDDAMLRRSHTELEQRIQERTSAFMQASQIEASARRALEASTARLEILSRTAHELAAASDDVTTVLELATHRLGETIGDGCLIRLISDDGEWLEPSPAFYFPDPDKRALARQLLDGVRQRIGDGIAGRVAVTGTALLVPEYPSASVYELATSAFHPLLEVLEVKSVLAIPLRSRERTVGVVSLMRSASGAAYTIDDQRFAQDVADRAGLAIDNAELVATLERRVAARTAALEAANQELEAFSYSVSHDLRAPLRTIDGFSQLLLSEHAGQLDAEGQHFLERIRTATQRMAMLIDDLLYLARITRVQLRWAPIDLSAIAGQIVAELRRRDSDRATPVHIAPGLTTEGDARLVTVALENLLGNAWKFTAKHAAAEIWLGAEQRDGQEVFTVRDTGAGFDMKYADKLFLPFHRLHSAEQFEGVGVGLATVHRVIVHHGGRIWAESSVDGGAAFFFYLGEPP
jgi:signal transduction histidine kinase